MDPTPIVYDFTPEMDSQAERSQSWRSRLSREKWPFVLWRTLWERIMDGEPCSLLVCIKPCLF